MKTSKQQFLLNRKEFLTFLLVPSILQFLFPHMWVDFFLLTIFYLAFTERLFVYFFMIFFWGIIYSSVTLENIGAEIIALGLVWYFYVSFWENSNLISNLVNIIIGCLLYLVVKLCISPAGCAWNPSMIVFFSVYFVLISVVISLILFVIRDNFVRRQIPGF